MLFLLEVVTSIIYYRVRASPIESRAIPVPPNAKSFFLFLVENLK